MAENTGNAFDFKLFRRLLAFTKPYSLVFYFVAFAAIIMSGLAVLRPSLLELAVGGSRVRRDGGGFIQDIILMVVVLMLEVIFQFAFIFYTTWLGQRVIRDMRQKLFRLVMRFRMKCFDRSAVGGLTTRAV